MEHKDFESPEDFRKLIPRTIQANVSFRVHLHKMLAQDTGLQSQYLYLCKQLPHIAFDSMFFVVNSQAKAGYRNVPFILWPHQNQVVTELINGYNAQDHDLTIDKSRKEGATELICKFIALIARLDNETRAIVGSRKEEFVDKGVQYDGRNLSGSQKSLMHKILYTYATAPEWFRPRLKKTHMNIELANGSVIDGESTNENFAAGDRASILLIDEIGRVDHSIADSIIGSVHDVCDFNVFNSTHWYGPEHPYNKLLTSGGSKIVVLGWEENPTKNAGLYRSPEHGVIEIQDMDYYKKLCPDIFNFVDKTIDIRELRKNIEGTRPDLLPVLDNIGWIADGGDFNEGGWRSAWYDKECKRRNYNKRYVARNLDRNPLGAGNNFFSIVYLRRARMQTVRPPKYRGVFRYEKNLSEQITRAWFDDGVDFGPMKIFVPLENGRLRQDHNYILSCDISRGIGSSNSVCQIVDKNTCEQVAVYANPNLSPESFGDMVAALYMWVGGLHNPFLIWEANGPGQIFVKRILFHGILNVYIRADEEAKTKKRKNQYGWWSTRGENGTKYVMLERLDVAIAQGIRGTNKHQTIIIRDEETINELETYIQYPNGAIGPSALIEDSVGAQSTHGDRVISIGLAILGMSYQSVATERDTKQHYPRHSIGGRSEQRDVELREEKSNRRFQFLEDIWRN